jgi:cobalt-zinc-cadmium resistance protein CzcA
LFLGSPRAALTVALILPLAALATFLLMRWFGMSANLMSLGGLAIAIGMLVDAAVVVVENIVSHLGSHRDDARVPRLHVIYRAVREVAAPVTTGIFIIMMVFLPLLTLQGLEGKLFSPVALTIMFALGASLLLSLTAIPMFGSFLLTSKAGHGEPWLVRSLNRLYAPVLRWSLKHARLVILAAVGLLVAAGLVYGRIGKTFMPTMDEGNLLVQLEKLPSISLDESLAFDMRVQQALLDQVPEITRIVARTGSDEIGLDPMGLNQTDAFLVLKPPQSWQGPDKGALIDRIRRVLNEFPGLEYAFTQPIEMRVAEMLTGVRGDVAVKIFGPDQAVLNRKAGEIAAALTNIDGAEDIYTARNEGVQYLRIAIERTAAGRLGVSVDYIEDALRSLVEGQRIGIVYEGPRRTPVVVRGSEAFRNSPPELANSLLTLPNGTNVPLSELADLKRVSGPVMITRENSMRTSVVIANVGGRDLVGFVEEAQARIADKTRLPKGYYLQWGGQFENQQRASARLALVVPVALGLIFLLLFSTFRSVRQAVLVMANVPFALVGGVFALWVGGQYLSVPASVGFIALLGIAVLNGVVLVTYFNQLRALGMSMERVVFEGSHRRLRPVLMTASIAAISLLPLLHASGPGSELQKPLAMVVIGGLVTSTLLTLIVLPSLYRRYGEPSVAVPDE